MKKFDWDIDLSGLVGEFCHIETNEGSIRDGRISGFQEKPFKINNTQYRLPLALELNGDKEDLIEFSQIKVLRLK
jgi:hypothetical protein